LTSSSELVSVRLAAESPAVEIRVIDAKLNVVAHAFGTLTKSLAPGIYDVVFSLGTSLHREIIAVRPGSPVERNVRLDFHSAAPLQGTEFYRPEDAEAVRQVTLASPPPQGHGELLICLRGLSSDAHPVDASMLQGFDIIDQQMNHVATLASASGTELCRAICVSLPEGGYALRHPLAASVSSVIDQSVYVCSLWRTMVFIPVRRDGPDLSLASVHMMEAGMPWIGHDENRVKIGIAAEAVLAAYRQGRNAFPPELLQLARENKADDPMLGLLAAHSLLLAHQPNWEMFEAILALLRETIPRHLDLLSLEAIGKGRRHLAGSDGSSEAATPPPIDSAIEWPPMLSASYRGILEIDARWPSLPLIVDSSPAERAASYLVSQETWCAWEGLPVASAVQNAVVAKAVRMFGAAAVAAIVDGFGGVTASAVIGILKLVGKSIAKRNWERIRQGRSSTNDANFDRLRSYLDERISMTDAKTLRGFLEKLDEKERVRIGLATGLPSRSVEKGLDALQSELSVVEPK
jgi:hypothetical protein